MPEYWKDIEDLYNKELGDNSSDGNLTNEEESYNFNRRDFLKFLGFSFAVASLASCEGPIQKVIPYIIKPEEVNPGIPNYYASSFADGNEYCSILVKTRD